MASRDARASCQGLGVGSRRARPAIHWLRLLQIHIPIRILRAGDACLGADRCLVEAGLAPCAHSAWRVSAWRVTCTLCTQRMAGQCPRERHLFSRYRGALSSSGPFISCVSQKAFSLIFRRKVASWANVSRIRGNRDLSQTRARPVSALNLYASQQSDFEF